MAEFDNRITFQKLEVFCAVVEEGGIGKAASALFLTQPVVSAHMRSLEDRMQCELLTPDGRGVALTEAGARVYRWASEVLRSGQSMQEELRDLLHGSAGTATIGASMSIGNYLLPELIADFYDSHPAAFIRVQNSTVETALDSLLKGDLDFCFVGSYSTLDADLYDAQLIGRPRYALVTSANDRETPERVGATELSKLKFIAPPKNTRVRGSQDFALSTVGVADRQVIMELGSAEAIKALVARGVGVALASKASVQPDVEAGKLREVEVEGHPMHDNLYQVQLRRNHLSPLQEELRAYLSAEIPALLTRKNIGV